MSMSLLRTWWSMVKTDAELSGEPIKDDAIVLSFSGSGASCHLTAKDLDSALYAQDKDGERLDFLIENPSWIEWREFDGKFKRCCLMTQDDDEDYTQLSGKDKYFATPRKAIDAAIAAQQGKEE